MGRAKGKLTQSEMIEALHTVELTPEVLTEVINRVSAEGVALVADEDEDLTRGGHAGAAVGCAAQERDASAASRRRGGPRPAAEPARAASRGAAPRTRCTPTSRRSAGCPC